MGGVAAAFVAALCSGCAEARNMNGGAEGTAGGASVESPGAGSDAGTSACAVDCASVLTPPCLVSVCDEKTGQCVVQDRPAGHPCDDGLFCTVGDTCNAGVCQGGKSNDCGMKPGVCGAIACDEATKSCTEKTALDGAPCPSADACTVSASCKAGACVGVPRDCFFAPLPDDCHVAVCNPQTGACEPVPGNEGQSCSKGGDPCAVGKVCQAGVCQGGTPKDCSALADGCNAGVCEAATGKCKKEPLPAGGSCKEAADECNDGACDAAGVCQKVPRPGSACASATNDCNAGVCDASGVCVATPVNEGGSCNDGNACTLGETCSAGVCKGGKAEGYVAYFTETFADNHAGWTLDAEWQIGPAKASPGNASSGAEDPAQDRTDTADNGIAGVGIGGYCKENPHPPAYLTSPPIDVTGEGPVWLSFYRYLNSDYAPYMTNTVDVFDGKSWQNLWTSAGPPAVKDTAWTLQSFELTKYRSAALRVRFGFEVGNGGVFTVSGWNVDDVVVASAVCGGN
jgi:hypothetical protein